MNISPKHFLQGATVAFFIYYLNPKMHFIKIALIGLLSMLVFTYLDNNNVLDLFGNQKFIEPFQSMDRTVRYGDIITLYTPEFKGFISEAPTPLTSQQSLLNYPVLTSNVNDPERLNRGSDSEQFQIINPNDPLGPGTTNPISTGSVICLRSVKRRRYVQFDDGNNMSFTRNKDGTQVSTNDVESNAFPPTQFIIEPEDNNPSNTISYGSYLNLKENKLVDNKRYLTVLDQPVNGKRIIAATKSTDSQTQSSRFIICDRYGNHLRTDWARRGIVNMTSQSGTNSGILCIDGNENTYAETRGGTKSRPDYIEIVLPNDVYIKDMMLYNRTGPDVVKENLNDFDFQLFDSENGLIDSQNFSNNVKDIYEWLGINRIARKVRIAKTKEGKLSVSLVKIYGDAVQHSILLKNPVISDVFNGFTVDSQGNKKFIEFPTTSNVIEHQSLPYTEHSLSLCFWLNINQNNGNEDKKDEYKILFRKGEGKGSNEDIVTNAPVNPGIWIMPGEKKFNLQLRAASTNSKRDGIKSSQDYIPYGKDFHVCMIIDAGVCVNTGWLRADFKEYNVRDVDSQYNPEDHELLGVTEGKYLIHPILKQYYRIAEFDPIQKVKIGEIGIKSILESSQDTKELNFKNAKINKYVQSPQRLGLKYMGVIHPKHTKSTMKLFINGRLSESHVLKGRPIMNKNALEICPPNENNISYNGRLWDVKYANYALSASQVQGYSKVKSTYVIKNIYWGNSLDRSARLSAFNKDNEENRVALLSHAELPEFDNKFSIMAWVKCLDDPSEKRWIIKKGEDRSEPGIYFSDMNKICVGMYTPKAPNNNGEVLFGPTAQVNKWYHIAVIVNDRDVSLYINGNVSTKVGGKKIGLYRKLALNGDPILRYTPLKIGGYQGYIKDVKFANYAITEAEIQSIMGRHPDHELNNKLISLFRKNTSCLEGVPHNLDINPDAMNKEKSALLEGNESDVIATLKDIEAKANKFNPTIGTPEENKRYYDMCNKNIPVTITSEQNNIACNKIDKKCLPIAPYKCQPRQDINDFDIRTHKNFYKYVNASKVKPPLEIVRNRELKEYDIKLHPDINKYTKNTDIDVSGLIRKIREPEKLKNIVREITSTGKINLGELVGSSGNNNQIREIAANLADSGELPVEQIVSGLSTDDLMKFLRGRIENGQVPVSRLLTLIKNQDELMSVIKNGVTTGDINMRDLVNEMSDTNELRDLVASQCKNKEVNFNQRDISRLPGFTQAVNDYCTSNPGRCPGGPGSKAGSGPSSGPQGVRSGDIDMSQYIRKDKIPCFGCKLK